eukprot:5542811-Pleurochrysis_carterae.AAC.1
MRASRLSTRPESCEGVGVAMEVGGAVLGAMLAHAAAAGAGGGLPLASGCPAQTAAGGPASHTTERTEEGRCWTGCAPSAAASLGWS